MYVLEGLKDPISQNVVSEGETSLIIAGDGSFGMSSKYLSGEDIELLQQLGELTEEQIEAYELSCDFGSMELGYTRRSEYRQIIKKHEETIGDLRKRLKKVKRKLDKVSQTFRKKSQKLVDSIEKQYRSKLRASAKKMAEYEVQISNDPSLQVNVVEYNRLKGAEEFYAVAMEKLKRSVAKYKKKSKVYRSEREKNKKRYRKAESALKKMTGSRSGVVASDPVKGGDNMPLIIGGGVVAVGLLYFMTKKKKRS